MVGGSGGFKQLPIYLQSYLRDENFIPQLNRPRRSSWQLKEETFGVERSFNRPQLNQPERYISYRSKFLEIMV